MFSKWVVDSWIKLSQEGYILKKQFYVNLINQEGQKCVFIVHRRNKTLFVFNSKLFLKNYNRIVRYNDIKIRIERL